jgi:ech hydrogenase subunit E
LRESILDLFEKTTGGRVIFSVNKIGGVHRDVSPEMLNEISTVIAAMKKEYDELAKVFTEDLSVKNRTVGVGVVSKADAEALCAVGPTARGSGVPSDMRSTGHSIYGELGFEPIVEESGDCYARTIVRVNEIYQSMDMIQRIIAKIPEGEIAVPVKGKPEGEFMARVEQPRGEACYYVKGNGTKNLERMRVRTPTNINIPFLVNALAGCDLADVPVIVLSIDPCISCTER